MWPFSKTKSNSNSEIHPLIKQFSALMENSKCLEWFGKVAGGWNMGLPADVAFDVQEAINLSYTITSMSGVSSTALVDAANTGDYTEINIKLHRSSRALNELAVDTSRNFSRIIEWANDHHLPQLQHFGATFYKQTGVPRNVRDLIHLRFLLVTEDYGITEIPAEVAKLPLLQGICIANNKITAIPTELYHCISLKRLDLEGNQISRVEDGIQRLANLYAIDLSENRLTHITPDISQMRSLKELDIRNQKTEIDMMRANDSPLSDASLTALYDLVETIRVKY